MSNTTERLGAGALLSIFSLSQNATAIYTTEDIIIDAATDMGGERSGQRQYIPV